MTKLSWLLACLVVTGLIALIACGGSDDYSEKGNAYLDQGNYQEAVEQYDESIRLDLQDAIAYYNRGNAYLRLGQHERAIQDYDEAIRLDPQLAAAYNNRGVGYDRIGKSVEAQLDYAKAKELGYTP